MNPVLLLDLDGTLVDTFPDIYAAARRALDEAGLAETSWDTSALRRHAGVGAQRFLELLTGAPVAQGVRERMLAHYADALAVHSQPYPGVETWLARCRCAVVTNKPEWLARPLLDALWPQKGLMLVAPETAGVAKPDPWPVTLAIQRMGATTGNTWLVGDDPRDYQAAEAAGVRFVLAAYGYTHPGEWGDLFTRLPRIDTPGDLWNVIELPAA